ncbi:MAG: hypothetical protein AMJ95_13380 [Omnitrophica WOR_2 bacterium SM23_72]|nr:MAG: hypothetical protein AMJ95_13380 [Omnitrophica WOR_2 bacterium SM23_72]
MTSEERFDYFLMQQLPPFLANRMMRTIKRTIPSHIIMGTSSICPHFTNQKIDPEHPAMTDWCEG